MYPHCYSQSVETPHPDELTTGEAKRVIGEIADIGVRLTIFYGGDPLMREDVYELIAHAEEGEVAMVTTSSNTCLVPNKAQSKTSSFQTISYAGNESTEPTNPVTLIESLSRITIDADLSDGLISLSSRDRASIPISAPGLASSIDCSSEG